MSSLVHNIQSEAFKEKYFLFTGAGISITLVWWPLMNSIFCILFFAGWLFLSSKKYNKKRIGIAFVLGSVYLLTLLGYFNSENTEHALFRIQQKVPLLMFPLIFATSTIFSPQSKQKIFYAFSFSVMSFCLYCIGSVLWNWLSTGRVENNTGYNLIPFTDAYPFMVGVFCIFCISFHFENLLKQRRLLLTELLPLFISWFMILLLANVMVLITGSLVTVYYSLKIFSKPLLRFLVLAGVILIFASTIFLNQSLRNKLNLLTDFSPQSNIELDRDASLGRSWDGKALRIAIWRSSKELVYNNLWLGLGTGDVQDELQKTYETRKFYFASRYNRYNAHNQYIQQLLTHGIAGLLFLLAGIFFPLFKNRNLMYSSYLIFLFVFAAICLTESILDINKGIVWYSFFNSIFVFSENKPNSI